MKVSVLFPVYKPTLPQLVEAIDSIQNQSHDDFECLFLYDAPSDDISELLTRYSKSDSRFRVIRAGDKGLTQALNLGLDISDGEFIARMDADDISSPNRFALQLKHLNDSNLDVVGGDYLVIDNSGNVVDARLVPKGHMEIGVVMAKGVPFAHSSVMIRRQPLIKLGLKYAINRQVVAEDYELWTRMYTHGLKFGNVSDWVLKFRDSETSLSKRVYSSSIKSNRIISKKFISANMGVLICAAQQLHPHKLDKINQEALAYLIFKLALCNGRFTQLSHLRKIVMKSKVIAAFALMAEMF